MESRRQRQRGVLPAARAEGQQGKLKRSCKGADDRKVREALDGLEAVAASNSGWATQDPAVRAGYQTMLKAMSKRASALSLPALYCVQIRR